MTSVTLQIELRQIPLGTTSFRPIIDPHGFIPDFVPGVDPYVHHYVALAQYDSNGIGTVISEYHGLATSYSSTGQPIIVPMAIGVNSNLTVYRTPSDYLGNNNFNTAVVNSGSIELGSVEYYEFQQKFYDAGDAALNDLNPQQMRYHLTKQNSNSVARWITEKVEDIFGIEQEIDPGLDFRRPGWNNELEDPLTESEALRGKPFPKDFCFPKDTKILLPDNRLCPIERIAVGDTVMSFDGTMDSGRGALVPARVSRVFRNVTEEWLEVTPNSSESGDASFHVTPGHACLNEFGQFETIENVAARGGMLIDASGTARKFDVASIKYSAETAALFETAEILRHDTNGSAALAPSVARGWATYNFEVEGLHTYVAANFRVHNDSQQIIDTAGAIGQAFGTQLGMLLTEGENQFVQLAAGTTLGLLTRNLAEVISDNILHPEIYFDPMKGVMRGGLSELSDIQVDIITAGLGTASSFLTAELAEAIGLKGFTAELFNVSVGTVTGAVLNHVVGNVVSGNISIAEAVASLDFKDAFGALPGAVGAFFGSKLAQEILPAESLEGSIGGSLGSIAGVAGAIAIAGGATAASALFAGLGAFIVPGIGAFFGTLIGTFLGDLFAEDPDPRGYAYFFAEHGSKLNIGEKFTTFDDFPRDAITTPGRAAASASQSYMDLVGGTDIDSSASGSVFGALGPNYGRNTQRFFVDLDEDNGELKYYYFDGMDRKRAGSAAEMVDRGIVEFIKDGDITGGDILLKRAVENSNAIDVTNLSGHMAVAETYARYLKDRDVINALIVAQPDSVFAAGWAISLLQAQELKLSETSKSDFNGGIKGFLQSLMIAGLAVDLYDVTMSHDAQQDKIFLDIRLDASATVPETAVIFADEVTELLINGARTLRFTFNESLRDAGFAVGASPSTSKDIWIAGNDRSYTYADTAGTGNKPAENSDDVLIGGSFGDTINGGLGADFIWGFGGDDVLNGGDGDDIIFGGAGDDRLDGGTGDDFFVGGAGKDRMDGGDQAVKDRELAEMKRNHRADNNLTEKEIEKEEALEARVVPRHNTVSYANTPTAMTIDLSTETGYVSGTQSGAGDTLIDIANAIGTDQNDQLIGNRYANVLEGGAGADILDGGASTTTFGGQPIQISDPGDIASYAGALRGVVASLRDRSINTGDAAGDEYRNIEGLRGSIYDDTLEGNDADNIVDGGHGNDVIILGGGKDSNDGEHGFDIASYRNATSGRIINLTVVDGTQNLLTDGEDRFLRIEGYEGTNYNDQIYGTAGKETLIGGLGDDHLEGRGGSDQLSGQAGNDYIVAASGDVIDGGDGNDTVSVWFNLDNLNLVKSGNDISIYVDGTPVVTVTGVENIRSTINGEIIPINAVTLQMNGFDPSIYLKNYPEVAGAFGNSGPAARAHYINYGYAEHRLIDDGLTYVASNVDLINAYKLNDINTIRSNGANHFQYFGHDEQRPIDFDVDQYLKNNNDVRNLYGSDKAGATYHFIGRGYDEHRLWEDPLAYIASYGDVISFIGENADGSEKAAATLRADAIWHFQNFGFSENRRSGIDFDAQDYAQKYDDVRRIYGNAESAESEEAVTMHFIQYGYEEGRTDDLLAI